MNFHQHKFGGVWKASDQAVHSIDIAHDVSRPLTTAYEVEELTPEERRQREYDSAMAKAAALTRFYGGGKLPVARPVAQSPASPKSATSEPGTLALHDSFRVSSSSLMAGGNSSQHKAENLPPLETEVLHISPSSIPPILDADVTSVSNAPQKMPAQKRPSDKEQVHDTIDATTLVIPKKPAPSIYPPVRRDDDNRTSNVENNEGGLLRGLAIDEQAQLLERYRRQSAPERSNNSSQTVAPVVPDYRSLAIQKQEKIWQQLSNSCNSIDCVPDPPYSSTSPKSVARLSILSPQEEQALLWEQLTKGRPSHASPSPSSTPSQRIDPLEEQARLLERYQRNRTTTARTAVEEQARMLREYQSSRPANPIEEQAKRLKEIQDDKEKKMLEMVCSMSQIAERRDEEDLSLQQIMEMSRREAQEQRYEEELVHKALEQSQQDIGGLELRMSIAELACQTSDWMQRS